MTPFAWIGRRLVCEGADGRAYVEKRDAHWIDRWIYRNLPRIDAGGNKIGIGPESRDTV